MKESGDVEEEEEEKEEGETHCGGLGMCVRGGGGRGCVGGVLWYASVAGVTLLSGGE